MSFQRPVVALAAIGNLGKYIWEELIADGRFDIVVLTRQTNKWLEERNVDVHISDYSEASVLSILDLSNAGTFMSFNNCADERFIDIHCAYLTACERSRNCKRFIASEYAGNIDDFPLHPRIYGTTRAPFRKVLQESTDIEWTLFNNGWFMDYFLPKDKTYMRPVPDEFPVDPNAWQACIKGTGDEPQSWTCCRDVGKAVVMLLHAPEWERTTYVVGQWGTFNEAIKIMETFFDKPLPKTYRSSEDINRALTLPPNKENQDAIFLAGIDEWTVLGATSCPREKTLRQRMKYFNGLHFTTIDELIRGAKSESKI
ncbi:MAG: hypothetical protein LQ347_002754 [Umbilicaria vellea]|nr:MAG: hypothetical protein LQ347_002754 [Umbilicaria vellea]